MAGREKKTDRKYAEAVTSLQVTQGAVWFLFYTFLYVSNNAHTCILKQENYM